MRNEWVWFVGGPRDSQKQLFCVDHGLPSTWRVPKDSPSISGFMLENQASGLPSLELVDYGLVRIRHPHFPRRAVHVYICEEAFS